jgi:protein gp37
MGDLFHEDVSYAYIDMVFIVMSICPQHRFMVLTKRPERMLAYAKSVMSRDIDIQWPLPNVWLGVTAENQEMADKRIPTLLQIPAAVRFVSVEPMLGPVDLSSIPGFHYPGCTTHDALNGRLIHHDDDYKWTVDEKLDWVICGGESAPKARPMHPDWVRSLRDQCQEADVPFFFKQWGEWGKAEIDAKVIGGAKGQINLEPQDIVGIWMFKVGKKAAGRLLDGRTWDEIPEVHTNE